MVLKSEFSSTLSAALGIIQASLASALTCTKVLAMAKLKQVWLCSSGLTKSFYNGQRPHRSIGMLTPSQAHRLHGPHGPLQNLWEKRPDEGAC